MRIGIALPQLGPLAGPDAVKRVAQHAEKTGYDSLWVLDRLLWPIHPQAPYPIGDGSLPEHYKRVLDPVETLTFAAALTTRVSVGTSVLNLPWYNPALLARRLATLDVLSGGRLLLGLGIGWSPDEYDAAGAPFKERGKRADEAISAMKALWTQDVVEFEGSHFRVPKSIVGLKPVQQPHPPIYMAAFTPAAMKRAAREANGWFPVAVPLAAMKGMFEQVRGMVREAGRKPDEFALVVRGNVEITEARQERADFTGTLEQIAEDIATTQQLGASELVLDVNFSKGTDTADDLLKRMDELRRLTG